MRHALNFVVFLAALHAAEATTLLEPANGAVTMMSIPHFRWQPASEQKSDYHIQIAADEKFTRIVDEDRIAPVINRYVPDKELAPGDYWWRVAGATGKFTVRQPERIVEIPKSATFADIQRAFATQTPALIKFEKSDYRLDPGGAAAFINFTNATDLVIDGNGANMTFTGFLKFVKLEHCRRVLVKNLTFDYDPLPYTAGRVLTVDTKAGTFDVEIAPGHPLPETNPYFEKDKKGMIVDPKFPRMKRGVTLVFEHAGWQKLGERRYRFTAARAKQTTELAPGDVYVLDPRIATGFDVDACDEIVFYNLTAYAVANEGFNSHYGNRLSILHCGIRLKPGRFIAANNGGHNHHNARVGPWIEGCTWENTGDDICHVNCLVMGVEEKLASDRVRLPLRNPYDAVGPNVALDIQRGDVLQFFNRAEGRLISERKVVSSSHHAPRDDAGGFLTRSVRTTMLDVTLDGDVGDIVTGRPGVKRVGLKKVPSDATITQVFNASRTCNQFVFRNNTVRNGRRIGVLAKGRGGLIENNTFEGLGGGAVEFWNAPFEGLGAVDYVVRGNRIRDCGQLAREHAAIWATIFKSGADKLHRNLFITDNEITGFPSVAILLRDVQNAVVRGNTADVQLENTSIKESKP
ncbi:MAG: right-handed parallel beta-helix repeat-containing protein [Verrucomicrobia bacterium]|nr:right-handed parallel beta-helix repeat-containing protein [Verrucomicrobiota bacterium]